MCTLAQYKKRKIKLRSNENATGNREKRSELQRK